MHILTKKKAGAKVSFNTTTTHLCNALGIQVIRHGAHVDCPWQKVDGTAAVLMDDVLGERFEDGLDVTLVRQPGGRAGILFELIGVVFRVEIVQHLGKDTCVGEVLEAVDPAV